MIDLPQVTLVSWSGINIEAHKKALAHSCKGIRFGAIKMIETPSKDINEWSYNIVYNLGDYIKTDFALLIHDDGFVVNPQSWKDEFLDYDYIGSPFPLPTDDFSYRDNNGTLQRVGNSVSLRSRKLLNLPKKIGMEWKPFHGYFNEDGFISVNMRHVFEEWDCLFAPFELAIKFGRECPLPENKGIKPFVFHKYEGENANYPKYEN